jgi:hypothetical protein
VIVTVERSKSSKTIVRVLFDPMGIINLNNVHSVLDSEMQCKLVRSSAVI